MGVYIKSATHQAAQQNSDRNKGVAFSDLKPLVRRMAICFASIHLGSAVILVVFRLLVGTEPLLTAQTISTVSVLAVFALCFALTAIFTRFKLLQLIVLALEIVGAVLDNPEDLYGGVLIGIFLMTAIVYGYGRKYAVIKGFVFLAIVVALILFNYVNSAGKPAPVHRPEAGTINSVWLLVSFSVCIYFLLRERTIMVSVVDKPELRLADYGLNQRETTIFRLYGENKSSSKEISEIVHLPPATIDKYTQHLAKKMGVRDRKELIRLATMHRLV